MGLYTQHVNTKSVSFPLAPPTLGLLTNGISHTSFNCSIKKTYRTQNNNAYKSTVYCRKWIQYSYSIQVRICIIIKGYLIAGVLEKPSAKSYCPPFVRAMAGCTFSLESGTIMMTLNTLEPETLK